MEKTRNRKKPIENEKVNSMKKPLISVCVVTYQHKNYIGECLDSILRQKGEFSLEILVHDDASTDGSQEMIRIYQEKYPDIVFPILQKENQYSQGKHNITGIFNFPRAKGDFISVIDGDDFFSSEEKLEKQRKALEEHPEAILSFHPVKVIMEDGREGPKKLLMPYEKDCIISEKELITHRGGIAFSSLFFRRSLLYDDTDSLKLPEFYYAFPVGDRPLELMTALKGKAVYLSEALSAYRFHLSGSWTVTQGGEKAKAKQEQYFQEMKQGYALFLKESQGKYKHEVEESIHRLSFSIAMNLRDFSEIYSRENRSLYKELSVKEKLLLRLESHLPGLYRFLQRHFGMERNKI